MPKVSFICLQRIDFTNDKGERVQGVNAWYLDPAVNTANIVGTRPQKLWLSVDFLKEYPVNTIGDYEYECTPRGKIASIKKL